MCMLFMEVYTYLYKARSPSLIAKDGWNLQSANHCIILRRFMHALKWIHSKSIKWILTSTSRLHCSWQSVRIGTQIDCNDRQVDRVGFWGPRLDALSLFTSRSTIFACHHKFVKALNSSQDSCWALSFRRIACGEHSLFLLPSFLQKIYDLWWSINGRDRFISPKVH